jgi:hypothetical protein
VKEVGPGPENLSQFIDAFHEKHVILEKAQKSQAYYARDDQGHIALLLGGAWGGNCLAAQVIGIRCDKHQDNEIRLEPPVKGVTGYGDK